MLLFALCFLCISCDPPQNAWRWNVKNNTGQTLKLKYPEYSINDNNSPTYRIAIISQDDSIFIYGNTTDKKKVLNINYFFNTMTGRYGEDIYWQILSEDDVVLRTWNYLERGLPEQRFFDESSWYKEQKNGDDAFVVMEYSWTFDILPEDISLE